MRVLFTLVAAAVLTLTAEAALLSENRNQIVTEPEPELVFHTAAPGIVVMPRNDASQMVTAYDVSFIIREDMVFTRWGKLNENGESDGLWTKWRDCAPDDVLTFSTPSVYVLETFAEATGKERSSTQKVTFKVDYLSMISAPGITLMPVGERGYYVLLTSLYGNDIYYRWKYADEENWTKWYLYTDSIPFTETGKYVLEANCDGGVLSAYIEVPSVDYYITGDVNHNGTVGVEDLTALIDMLLHEEFIIGTGDVNKDGQVGIDDVVLLIDMILNDN